MQLPTITQYMESVGEPHGLFRTLGEPECERDPYGRPVVFAGGNAAVFIVRSGGRRYALKCFTRPVENVERVCECVSASGSRLLLQSVYLPQEIYVYGHDGSGRWYGVILQEWAQGHTLDFEMRKAILHGDRAQLGRLAELFDEAAIVLLSAEWAHGDIKPENIMITPTGVKLTDYDSMFFPELGGGTEGRFGTPVWQHPERGRYGSGRHMDDYSVALLSATLHALAADPSLHSRFGDTEVFLFGPAEILGGASGGYAYVLDRAARSCDAPLYRLLKMLDSPVPELTGLAGIISAFRCRPQEQESCKNCDKDKGDKDNYKEGMDGGNGCALHVFNDGNLWGYADGSGAVVIPALYDGALEFSGGLAAVKLGCYNHFIDPAGRCAINCAGYESVKPFRNGTAAVKTGGEWVYIDMTGRIVTRNS